MALNLKTLATRTATAVVFVAVLLTCINLNYLTFTALFFVVSVWGLLEFYTLSEKMGAKPYKLLGVLSAITLYLGAVASNSFIGLYIPTPVFWMSGIVLLFLCFVQALFHNAAHTIRNLAYTIMGLVYAVLPFMLLIGAVCVQQSYTFNHPTGKWYIDCAPYNPGIMMGVILLIWANDTFAYLCGSLIGKRKLYERISPGKTWEGSLGGMLLTLGATWLIAHWYDTVALKHWIVIALIVCILGTIGDLVESMLKRQAGVKDSGRIMPGHGGILDRFDSLLFVSPFVYAYLNLVYNNF